MLLHVTDLNSGLIEFGLNYLIINPKMMSPHNNCMTNPPVISNKYGIPGVIHVFGVVQYS